MGELFRARDGRPHGEGGFRRLLSEGWARVKTQSTAQAAKPDPAAGPPSGNPPQDAPHGGKLRGRVSRKGYVAKAAAGRASQTKETKRNPRRAGVARGRLIDAIAQMYAPDHISANRRNFSERATSCAPPLFPFADIYRRLSFGR